VPLPRRGGGGKLYSTGEGLIIEYGFGASLAGCNPSGRTGLARAGFGTVPIVSYESKSRPHNTTVSMNRVRELGGSFEIKQCAVNVTIRWTTTTTTSKFVRRMKKN
jgi:hypothetical protein